MRWYFRSLFLPLPWSVGGRVESLYYIHFYHLLWKGQIDKDYFNRRVSPSEACHLPSSLLRNSVLAAANCLCTLVLESKISIKCNLINPFTSRLLQYQYKFNSMLYYSIFESWGDDCNCFKLPDRTFHKSRASEPSNEFFQPLRFSYVLV